jgi:hypothetical protein
MRVYIQALILSFLFDIGTTIANVFKYNDPYLKHEMNIFLKGKYWPWLFVNGLAQFVILYVLFSIAWKHRSCLVPRAKASTFWEWHNSCLYDKKTVKMTFPKWKNSLVYLLFIVLLPMPLLHMIWGLLNTFALVGCDISFLYQYEKIFIFMVATPLSIAALYIILKRKPNIGIQVDAAAHRD